MASRRRGTDEADQPAFGGWISSNSRVLASRRRPVLRTIKEVAGAENGHGEPAAPAQVPAPGVRDRRPLAETALGGEPAPVDQGLRAAHGIMSIDGVPVQASATEFAFDNLDRLGLHPLPVNGYPVEQVLRRGLAGVAADALG